MHQPRVLEHVVVGDQGGDSVPLGAGAPLSRCRNGEAVILRNWRQGSRQRCLGAASPTDEIVPEAFDPPLVGLDLDAVHEYDEAVAVGVAFVVAPVPVGELVTPVEILAQLSEHGCFGF